MNRHYIILSTICLSLITGCTAAPSQSHLSSSEAIKAETFSQQGQHKQAASLYQSLAETKPTYRNDYRLLAAEAYIQSGDTPSAQALIEPINPNTLTAEQRNKLNLISVQINLSNGETEKALKLLSVTQPYNLSITDQIIFYQSLAFAHSLTGNLLQSVQARIELTPLLQSTQQLNENNSVILNTLTLLPQQMLSQQQSSMPPVLKGWISLANLLTNNQLKQHPDEFQLALIEWQQFFPQHPANAGFIQSYSAGLQNTFNTPNAIALLLPESGRFAKAAATIKTGFMAAYQHSQSSFQPSIRFYDSSANNAINLYYQAVSEGAELVIGPLSKDNIQDLALGAELTVPVLALNHITNLAKNNLFQFGLSPIDESKQLTSKAASDGIQNILLLTPETNNGLRTTTYLTEFWQQKGGTVLESQHYKSRENDFSAPIKDLLNLTESQYRYRKLKQFLARNLEFTERRRTDVDAIFISASAKKARSIYPQLRFHRATGIPVYATPQVYTGTSNPSADIDLNSIVFCDIPWLFADIYTGELSQESLRDSWQHIPTKYLRLLALGIDSFNIIEQLEHINNTPYPGASGTLSMDRENRITRQLACAKFIDGQATLQQWTSTETVEEPVSSEEFYP